MNYFWKEIRSKRKYNRVPIVKNLKNKGIDESVKEEQEDNVRKTNEEYPPGLRYLPTRMKYDNITTAVMGMSLEQKQAILRMGFGSILQVNITSYPSQKKNYGKGMKNEAITSPITLLILVCMYNMKYSIEIDKMLPFILHINGEQQMLNFKRDFEDEETYTAVIEHNYGVILIEKSTMGIVLKDGDVGEGNSSPVRGLIVTEVNVEKEFNYSRTVDTNSLTMTQFHRLLGVNE
ncbi:unnamed protein product [Lactuca saligna]|uniref:Uncharacterized protein n=1 Tax=Lactuca saligna TaxID=75948 RepID=A0AA36EKV9_LACSI|nr:unnamed protein product [Lactuca saligna]